MSTNIDTRTMGYLSNEGTPYVFLQIRVNEQLHCFNQRLNEVENDPTDLGAWLSDVATGEHIHPQVIAVFTMSIRNLVDTYYEQDGNDN